MSAPISSSLSLPPIVVQALQFKYRAGQDCRLYMFCRGACKAKRTYGASVVGVRIQRTPATATVRLAILLLLLLLLHPWEGSASGGKELGTKTKCPKFDSWFGPCLIIFFHLFFMMLQGRDKRFLLRNRWQLRFGKHVLHHHDRQESRAMQCWYHIVDPCFFLVLLQGCPEGS